MQSHVLLKKIPRQHLKYVLYQNKVYGFLPQVPLTLPILFQKKIFVSSSYFVLVLHNFPPFELPQITSL
jgi:hypothetical protein